MSLWQVLVDGGGAAVSHGNMNNILALRQSKTTVDGSDTQIYLLKRSQDPMIMKKPKLIPINATSSIISVSSTMLRTYQTIAR